jgi:hypothetical protein
VRVGGRLRFWLEITLQGARWSGLQRSGTLRGGPLVSGRRGGSVTCGRACGRPGGNFPRCRAHEHLGGPRSLRPTPI